MPRFARSTSSVLWMVGLAVALAALAILATMAPRDAAVVENPTVVPVAANPPPQQPHTAPTAVTGPFRVGASVEIASTDSCLRIRTEPGLAGAVLSCQGDGFAGRISEGPVEKDGLRWWHVIREQPYQVRGWAAEEFLRPKATQ